MSGGRAPWASGLWARLLLCGLLLCLCAGRALATVPPQDLDWHDTSRQRAVPVRLYWPVQASGPVPLVVFSHGIGGSRHGYSYLGQHFAAQGMASLHVQHVGSDRSLWRGNPLTLVGRLQGAAQDTEALARVQDMRFALDELLAHAEYGPRIDRQRIAAAGHSYGANTVMLLAGAQVPQAGAAGSLLDERFRAALLLSAPPFYGLGDPRPILRTVQLPTLHVTATDDVIRIPGYHSGAADRVALFDAVGGPLKVLAMFQGGSHSIFTDRAGTGGTELNPQVKAATQALATAFLGQVFQGDGSALQQWPLRFSGLLARFVPAAP
jgi:predicted dienelactone hydrolase